MDLLQVTLTATNPTNSTTVATGDTLTLTWNSPGATSCVASGGASGDGWAGPRAASGTFQLTEQAGGQISYALKCSAAGSAGSASVSVFWQFIPVVDNNLNGSTNAAAGGVVRQLGCDFGTLYRLRRQQRRWLGRPTGTARIANSDCERRCGTVTYVLTCGPSARTGSAQVTTTVSRTLCVFAVAADANPGCVSVRLVRELELGKRRALRRERQRSRRRLGGSFLPVDQRWISRCY